MRELKFSCACGALHGRVELKKGRGQHLRCYCSDCQSAAHALQGGDRVLDENGGTRVYQTTPKMFHIDEGELGCLQLREGGLLRFYAKCCQSPIANLMNRPQVAFASVHVSALDDESRAAIGPVEFSANLKGALGRVEDENRIGLGRVAARAVLSMAAGRFKGEHRGPFFKGGRPVVEPHLPI